VGPGRPHRLDGQLGGVVGEGGEDAAGLQPARTLGSEDGLPGDVPGLSCEAAVLPRSEQPRADRMPKPRSVKLSPLRTFRPIPSYGTQITRLWPPPPW
jgi:hypothetical protein